MKEHTRAKPENFHGKKGKSKFGEAHTISAANLWVSGKNTDSEFTNKLPSPGSAGKKNKGGS